MSEPSVVIKKRSRPPPRVRAISLEREDEEEEHMSENEEEAGLPIADLIELRKLRRSREGIDVAKLNKGDGKKKKKRPRNDDELTVGEAGGLQQPGQHQQQQQQQQQQHQQPTEQVGLRKGALDDDDDEGNKAAKARRVVRANNFAPQTNVMAVDKHMMAYIEQNLKVRSRPKEEEQDTTPADPQEALYRIVDKYKLMKEAEEKKADEGSVTNSLTMLTAIPEVDLGMDNRLKNIEETEKAKRVVKEHRQEKRPKLTEDEEHLIAQRWNVRPNARPKSDADILRDAKLEAMGLPPQEESPRRRSNHDRHQMATDEMVMERFKKRVRM